MSRPIPIRPAGHTGVSLATEPDIARALDNRPTVITTTDGDGRDVLSATMPGSSGTTVRGALRLTCPLDQVGTRVHRIWGALALAGAGILAAVALVAFSLARWITRPLRTLEAATTQLAEGQLTTPPDATAGPPELRRLATAFTHTATRLQHLLKAQQAFASEASHQLKTPLTALRLRLENFEPHLDPRAHGSLEEAVGEVERLGRMVQGLLALARLENTATTPEPVDLDTVLAERAAMREPLAAEQYVALDITGPPATCGGSRVPWRRASTTSSGSGAPPSHTTTAPASACPSSATSSTPPAAPSASIPPLAPASTPVSDCAPSPDTVAMPTGGERTSDRTSRTADVRRQPVADEVPARSLRGPTHTRRQADRRRMPAVSAVRRAPLPGWRCAAPLPPCGWRRNGGRR
ncbi:HAMP domain-containing protein [Streptomyces panaciradicis]|nr:HAMP domain-containing sensor histidine kinase [Streptomyces panaciradicis]MCL6667965.1 HAMP domain-containing protein [Streptomyces panaciradicis]